MSRRITAPGLQFPACSVSFDPKRGKEGKWVCGRHGCGSEYSQMSDVFAPEAVCSGRKENDMIKTA